MNFPRFWLLLLAIFFTGIANSADENIVSESNIKTQLERLKSSVEGNTGNHANNNENVLLAKHLEDTLRFLNQAENQQNTINELENRVRNANNLLSTTQKNISRLRTQLENVSTKTFEQLSIEELEKRQSVLQADLQHIQGDIADINLSLIDQRSALDKAQQLIADNNLKIQQLIRWGYDRQASKPLKEKYSAEIKYLELRNKYNTILSQNNDLLISLDETKRTELNLKQDLINQQITTLQTVLNEKRLIESEQRAKLAENRKENNKEENPFLKIELNINAEISQFSLRQTQQLNTLSQENLRIKNVLDSLTQTQRNIDEQISALQGTLVLSRIINQQKLALPTEQLIKGLPKEIAELRVTIFDYSQQRDELYNLTGYIQKLETEHKAEFTQAEKIILENTLIERRKLLEDLIKGLNNQLTISNTIEANQQQVIAISDALQNKLQQQSFWVQSNNPIDLAWLESFPKLAITEITEIGRYIGFDNIGENFVAFISLILILIFVYALINWKKAQIKQRLATIASQVNTLKNDSHWHTPEAMLWTIILALPSTMMFLAIGSIFAYIFLRDPLLGWSWLTKMSGYWLFFATILSLLRPNGIAFRHFGMPQASNETFQRLIKQSIWIVALLLVSSILSKIDIIGFNNDVIGQVMTLLALVLCFVVTRLLDRGIAEYENARTEDGRKRNVSLFKLVRLVLIVVPITLIVLIVLGYYYTAVYIIDHLIRSYVLALVWVFGRYIAYRFLNISSLRMRYRRLLDKRQKIKELEASDNSESKQKPEDLIKISTVNEQIFRMADLIGWVVLIGLLYTVWSDLITVAYYLDGVILWQSIQSTTSGNVVEAVTLLNLLRASLYVIVTYVLVKNIAGIMEILFFSRVKLAKGTPHTITATLTYLIVTVGGISSFSALGLSWSKIQWVFTALSVGLGFGVREIFGSFVSGSILLFERPIRVGDKVTVGAYTGVITKIKLRSTTLLNSDNMEVVLPNQAFVTDRFINWTYNNTVTRLNIDLKVAYGSDIELVKRLLLQATQFENNKILDNPAPEINIKHFGDNGMEFELLVHVAELGHRNETLNNVYSEIDRLFKANNVKIAFNQLDVHLTPASAK